MSNKSIFDKYKDLLDSLKLIVSASQGRVIKNEPDHLFAANVNFFVKSYLISACTYLEAYLQDIAFDLAKTICARADAACIPHNFVHWKTAKEVKDKDLKFSTANFKTTKQQIADEISPNPYKTIRCFRFLGVDLSTDQEFNKNKDFINSIITKRNNIIHHNDAANDVSFNDIEKYIDVFIDYMRAIQKAAYNSKT